LLCTEGQQDCESPLFFWPAILPEETTIEKFEETMTLTALEQKP